MHLQAAGWAVSQRMVLLEESVEAKTREIQIAGLQGDTFESFVDYLHNGNTPRIPDEQQGELYVVAHK